MDVAGELHQIHIVFNDDAFESSLEQMAGATMPVIESPGIGYPQPLHAFRKIGLVGA
jgi:hypothetical protein